MKVNVKSEAIAGIVAGAAFIASAGHIMTVVSESNPWWISPVYPIGIDGLIYVGIRSVQSGRRFAGLVALLIGAFYSLAFNLDAEGAVAMDARLIASSMPVCMFASFLIEATGRTKDVPEKVVEKTTRVYPEMLPIVPLAPKPKPRTVPAPKPRTNAGTRGRAAAWDVEKAVRLLMDGRTDSDVLEMVDGLTAKPWQRTKRAVRLIQDGRTDAEVASTSGVSVLHAGRVRDAIGKDER